MASFGLGHFISCLVLTIACKYALCRKEISNVRLVNENDQMDHQGFVEVYSYGMWRKICNVRWDNRNDLVTCKQLGFADVGNKPKT